MKREEGQVSPRALREYLGLSLYGLRRAMAELGIVPTPRELHYADEEPRKTNRRMTWLEADEARRIIEHVQRKRGEKIQKKVAGILKR